MTKYVVISGPIAAGKSSFAETLMRRYSVKKVSTRKYILDHENCANERGALQAAGAELDKRTGGSWVADASQEQARDFTGDFVLLDCARIAPQVTAIRERFGDENVLHVHLTAPDEVLSARYKSRSSEVNEFETYGQAKLNATEAAIGDLEAIANRIVDTSKNAPEGQVTYAIAGFVPAETAPAKLVDVFIGAQWGSEGKGNVCAFLSPEYDILMRVGGPNAGHMAPEPLYKYVQLPSGTGANPSAKILIAAGSTISLSQLLKEIDDHPWLKEAGNLVIDGQAMMIDESDREMEGAKLDTIASTKQGVGAASARKIMGRGGMPPFGPEVRLASQEPALAAYVGDTKAALHDAYAAGMRIMLEGTQGTDLSIHHGNYPHVTSRETSASGCLSDAGIAPLRVRKVIMVTRTYPIRVGGTSGPMGIEISFEEVAKRSRVPVTDIVKTEIGTISRRKRRIAEFDWEQLRRSAELNGATDIALTFADYLGVENKKARKFSDLLPDTQEFVIDVERVSGCAVNFIVVEFAKDGVIDRRDKE